MPASSPGPAVQDGLCPAVLGPAGYVIADSHRPLLTVGNRTDPVSTDALGDQEVAYSVCAARAKGDVVLTSAPLIGMTFDGHRVLRILVQPPRLASQRLLGFRSQLRAVRRKINDIADVLDEVALRAGCCRAVTGAKACAVLGRIGTSCSQDREQRDGPHTRPARQPHQGLHLADPLRSRTGSMTRQERRLTGNKPESLTFA